MNVQDSRLVQPNLLKYNLLYYFAGIAGLHILCAFLISHFVMTDDVMLLHLSSQISVARVYELIALGRKWSVLYMALLPVLLFLKFLLISSVIAIGILLLNRAFEFGALFKVVIMADFIFILGTLTKIVYFLYIKVDYTYEDVSYFSPLSMVNFFEGSTIERIWMYPLQTINLFEVAYILFISYFLQFVINTNLESGFKLVSFTYLPGLIIWVLFVVFLAI